MQAYAVQFSWRLIGDQYKYTLSDNDTSVFRDFHTHRKCGLKILAPERCLVASGKADVKLQKGHANLKSLRDELPFLMS